MVSIKNQESQKESQKLTIKNLKNCMESIAKTEFKNMSTPVTRPPTQCHIIPCSMKTHLIHAE